MFKKTDKYAHENKMKINYKKTKLMVFNPGYSRDFFPRFNFNNNELEVVEEAKLLGFASCKFCIKSPKHPKFTKWFQRNKKIFPTRAPSTKFCEVSSRTKRFERSPISFLTTILNSM